MNKRATKKSEVITADKDDFEDPSPIAGGGPDRDLQEEPEKPKQEATEPGISWGPGRNFHGWAMTLVVLALLGGVGFSGVKLFGDTVNSQDTSATGQGRKELERQVRTLGADLCAASNGVGQAPDASAQIFEEKVHGPLHALAGALAEEDRAAAAELLRDKFNVEEDLRRKAAPPELTASFAALNESTMDGLRILSLPSPACLAPAVPPAAAPPAEAPPPPAPAP